MLYEVTLEVDGIVTVTVEADDEQQAVRRARIKAELGEGADALDYQAVRVRPEVQP